jgi:hypothetical protein
VAWHSAGVGDTTEPVDDTDKYCLKNIENWLFFIIFVLKRKEEGFWEGYGSFLRIIGPLAEAM